MGEDDHGTYDFRLLSVRDNNDFFDWFSPTRVLRQGDPLSPCIFFLCVEGLTNLLLHEEEAGNLIGVEVCKDAPVISRLLFADDSLILIKPNDSNV